MANKPQAVQSREATLPEALTPPPARIAARFNIRNDVVAVMGLGGIQTAVASRIGDIRQAIKKSVVRAYQKAPWKTPGGIISGSLHSHATQNFGVKVYAHAQAIIVDAVWSKDGPASAYFYAQLWGVPRGYSKIRPNMHIRRKAFIKLDAECLREITGIINLAVRQEIQKATGEAMRHEGPQPEMPGGPQPEPKTAAAIIPQISQPITTSIGRSVSMFRGRKTLRGVGVPAEMARSKIARAADRGRIDYGKIAMILRSIPGFDFAKLASVYYQDQNA